MYIALRTDSPVTDLALVGADGAVASEERWESGRQLADHLLKRLKKLLTKNQADWPDLKGVIVFRGPGSFTGLRIGITVANTIAYAQSIPIVGTDGDDWLKVGIARLSRGESDKQVTPHYGAEPNITKPKR